MSLYLLCRRMVLVALLASGAGAMAAQTGDGGAAVREKAQTARATSADLQKLVQQIGSQREKMIADHEALAKQLKDATDEQRKAIMEKMQEQKKAFEAAQSALHKQIRDEQRRLRQAGVPGKR